MEKSRQSAACGAGFFWKSRAHSLFPVAGQGSNDLLAVFGTLAF